MGVLYSYGGRRKRTEFLRVLTSGCPVLGSLFRTLLWVLWGESASWSCGSLHPIFVADFEIDLDFSKSFRILKMM